MPFVWRYITKNPLPPEKNCFHDFQPIFGRFTIPHPALLRPKAVKSTIFKLEQSFLHIFEVAQNFQLNGRGCLAEKGGRGAAGPPYPPTMIHYTAF